MSNEFDKSGDSPVDNKVGSKISQKRIARGLTIEQVAEDLKYNIDYLRAIEESRYGDLPAPSYVRGYVRTIARYLELDGDTLSEAYAKEVALEVPDPERERHDTMRISIQSEVKANTWLAPLMVVLAIALVLGLFVLFTGAEKEGKVLSDSKPVTQPATPIDTIAVPPIDTVVPEPVAVVPEKIVEVDSTPVVTLSDSLILLLTATEDSSIVQVAVDGSRQYNDYIRSGETRRFAAKESFHIKAGRNGILSYDLNGKKIFISGAWESYAKITSAGVLPFSKSEWKRKF